MTYRIAEYFEQHFGKAPELTFQSPGRINIIGEHTDYNDGYVLPAAIDRYMFIGIRKIAGTTCTVYSVDYDEGATIDLADVQRTDKEWLNLISGVVNELSGRIEGFELAFGGNIPEGAGLSSSAALCCGVGMALSELFGLGLSKWEIARISQQAEHRFALVECGIMDQFACMFGLTNHVLELNCQSMQYEASEVDISGYKLLVLNSNVKHSLGDSDYNTRKQQSNKALQTISAGNKQVKTYQDVTTDLLKKLRVELNSTLWKRAFHVASENERVHAMKAALKSKNIQRVGDLLTRSHQSLKDYYEVTCVETDFLVEELNKQETVYGSRQVGGGFGGCILAIAKDANISEMLHEIEKSYRREFGLKMDNIPIKISKGCHKISQKL